MRGRTRLIALAAALAAALGGLYGAPGPAWAQLGITASVSTAEVDPLLLDVLRGAAPGQPAEAVLTFGHDPMAADLLAVTATGVDVVPFRVLPMLGVRGTSTQILALLALPGLRSIYSNQQLA